MALLRSKNGLRLLKMIRITKLLKMLRGTQLLSYLRATLVDTLDRFNMKISDAFAKMFWLFFTLLTLAHWLGCLLYFAVRLWSFPRTSWVVLAGLVTHEGKPLMNVLSRYLWCLHKILLVFVSVAYEYPATSQICMETTGWCLCRCWCRRCRWHCMK